MLAPHLPALRTYMLVSAPIGVTALWLAIELIWPRPGAEKGRQSEPEGVIF